jgi:hypothetical protein
MKDNYGRIQIDAHHRNRIIIVLCAIVFIASIIGVATYVAHVEQVNDQRAKVTKNVCSRQNQVIDVLSYLVSSERQKLVQGSSGAKPSEALAASNERIRSLVRIISVSPC